MGCVTDDWSLRQTLFSEPAPKTIGGAPTTGKPVKTPNTPKLPADHLETSERVSMLGQRIVTQNPFTGLEPNFFMLDVPEVVLFHRGTADVFISKGLIKQCQNDDQLAAVLCSELGQMVAEKRGLRKTGNDKDSIPASALPGGTLAGGTAVDLGRDAEAAFRERSQKKEAASVAKLSRELLTGAGFDASELEKVAPLLKQSERSAVIRKQMCNTAPPPKWEP
jgi:predicted Zn-dependent protease